MPAASRTSNGAPQAWSAWATGETAAGQLLLDSCVPSGRHAPAAAAASRLCKIPKVVLFENQLLPFFIEKWFGGTDQVRDSWLKMSAKRFACSRESTTKWGVALSMAAKVRNFAEAAPSAFLSCCCAHSHGSFSVQ